MSSSLPKIRSACENCHKRKIRCNLSPGSGTCQNCSANGSFCYFAPRIKAGRPRLTDKVQHQLISHNDTSGHPYLTEGAFKNTYNTSMLSDSSHSTPIPLFQASRNIGERTLADELHTLVPQNPVQTDQTQEQTTSIQNGSSTFSDRILTNSIFGDMVPTSTPLETSHFAAPNTSSGFDLMLRSCEDLDHHCRFVEELNHRVDYMCVVLNGMESACMVTMQVSSSLSISDGASVALISAAFYKIFELCQKIVSHVLSSLTSHEPPLDTLVLLKRLDLMMLQAKIVLVRVIQPEAVETASQIHQWIDSFVKHHFHSWSW